MSVSFKKGWESLLCLETVEQPNEGVAEMRRKDSEAGLKVLCQFSTNNQRETIYDLLADACDC